MGGLAQGLHWGDRQMIESNHNQPQDRAPDDYSGLSLRRLRVTLPLIAVGLGVWIARDVEANSVGTKSAPPLDEFHSQREARDPFVMAAESLEPVSAQKKSAVTPPVRQGAKKRLMATSDETPFVVQERVSPPVVSIQKWLNPAREWPTNRVQIGDIVYPREALVSQILKGAGNDPALALAQQVAVARLTSFEQQWVMGSSMKSGLASALDEADFQLRLHPPGSAVQEEAKVTLLRLGQVLVEMTRALDAHDSRE